MKVLYIDFNTTGHHSIYYKTISQIDGIDPVLILPRKIDLPVSIQYEVSSLSRNMSILQYSQVMSEIKRIIENEKTDIVHILSGDMLYRFFGWKLQIKEVPVVVTFHHMEFSFLKKLSYRMLFKRINIGVTHTEYIYDNLKRLGINNIEHIEYPYLEEKKNYDKQKLKKEFGISENRKVLLAFGETRYDKGLDILLKALDNITEPFHLIIAGKPTEITADTIRELTAKYKSNNTLFLSYIDNELMYQVFYLSDIVVLPYRRKFAGASGPLTTAVAYGKMVIGPDRNSIGKIIAENHLGDVFECENQKSLEQCVSRSIRKVFEYDSYAKAYQKAISKDVFMCNYQRIYNDIIRRTES